MKKLLRIFFTACLTAIIVIGILTISAAQEQKTETKTDPKTLVGTWDLAVVIDGVEQNSIFIFTLKNDTLHGKWSSPDGEIPMRNIKLNKDKITLELNIPGEYDYVTIYISGTITGEKMTGAGNSGEVQYPFTAVKRKKKIK